MSVAREQQRPRTGNGPLIGMGVALLAALGVGGWALTHSRPEGATVVRRDITASVPIQGVVVAPPDAQANVPAPYHTTVAKVYTSVGHNVNRGETLVELTLPNVQEMYQQAKANVKAAETAYANAKQQYQSAVDAARKNLATTQSAENAWRQQSASPSASGGAATGMDAAAATQARVQSEAALAQAQSDLNAQLQPYQQQLDAARAAYKEAQSGRRQGMVRAPISGTLLVLNAQPGAEVGKDQRVPIATIVNLEKLQVQGPITNAQASFVKAGMPAEITVAELPGEKFNGRVHALTTQTTGTLIKKAEYVGLVHVVQNKGKVKPGMKATAAVNAGEVKNVLAVPADAVQADKSGRFTVRVNRNGQWTDQIVEVGLSDGQYTEIKSGLNEGDSIQVKKKVL